METIPPQIRVLIVEDERKLAHLVERHLSKVHYHVELAFDGETALEFLSTHEVDIILLDLNLPGMSGFDILKELHQRGKNIPTLILSARNELDDRLRGINLGADDYLMKPFDPTELLARMQAILRRSGVTPSSIFRADDLAFDPTNRTVTRGGKELKLTQRELALLEFFLRNKNQVLTRKRIVEEVWGITYDTGTNIIDVYVSHLRRAIDDGFERKLIQTAFGQGFILKDA